ncbi:MAG: hypothetical protein K8I00_04845 [Candidatus Omnitrophica bacterium]|nr:hypothetical protein [Candidatus Omnitrophota bacterium]
MVKTRTETQQLNSGKFLAALSYLSFFCIIPLILKKNNPFVQHHGKQGLVLFMAQVGAFVGHIIAGSWFLSFSSAILGGYAVLGIFRVLQGQNAYLWGISRIAEKITL